MKINLDKLQRVATNKCKHRGHKLRFWAVYPGESRSYASSSCSHCNQWVQVIDNPLPNEINIGGPALALGCVEEKQIA